MADTFQTNYINKLMNERKRAVKALEQMFPEIIEYLDGFPGSWHYTVNSFNIGSFTPNYPNSASKVAQND